jgi:hypothetical protein
LVALAVHVCSVEAIIPLGIDFPPELYPQCPTGAGLDGGIIKVSHYVRLRIIEDLGPVVGKVLNQIIADVGDDIGRCSGQGPIPARMGIAVPPSPKKVVVKSDP